MVGQTSAMLTKRVYEIDPLVCPQCGGQMSVIGFIEPPQADVIEKILRHCGLWHCSRAPPDDDGFVRDPRRDSQTDPDAPGELTFVPEDAIWAEARKKGTGPILFGTGFAPRRMINCEE